MLMAIKESTRGTKKKRSRAPGKMGNYYASEPHCAKIAPLCFIDCPSSPSVLLPHRMTVPNMKAADT